MPDRKNIKLPKPLFNAIRDDKPQGVTWPNYLEARCLTDRETTNVSDGGDMDVDALRDAIRKEIDAIDTLAFRGALSDEEAEQIISTLRAVEERTDRLEQMLEEMGAQR